MVDCISFRTMQNNKSLTTEEFCEPVYYCRRCHSLYIIQDEKLATDDWDGSYCGHCNSTDIGQDIFGNWLLKEEQAEKKRKEAEWNR